MGTSRPRLASSRRSDGTDKLKLAAEEAIKEALATDPNAAAKIRRFAPSTRPSNLRDLLDGMAVNYGPTRLCQIAEALGYTPEIRMVRAK